MTTSRFDIDVAVRGVVTTERNDQRLVSKYPTLLHARRVRKEMKLNMGCGNNKVPGFINVDAAPQCSPDLVADLEKTPWPWENDSAEAVLFNHSLEHMGADARVFKSMMQELYRICRNGAEVTIKVPHPRHDDFINDPTHVRAITPDLLCLLSKRANEVWTANGAANTPLAIYWGVDFEVKRARFQLDPRYQDSFDRKEITIAQLNDMLRDRNNVAKEIDIVLTVVKRGSVPPVGLRHAEDDLAL